MVTREAVLKTQDLVSRRGSTKECCTQYTFESFASSTALFLLLIQEQYDHITRRGEPGLTPSRCNTKLRVSHEANRHDLVLCLGAHVQSDSHAVGGVHRDHGIFTLVDYPIAQRPVSKSVQRKQVN